MATMYPSGYSTREETLAQLIARHFGGRGHPEYIRRLEAWLESEEGRFGVGNGLRVEQPAKPGFAPAGKSFHLLQRFASGLVAVSACDLVVRTKGGNHTSGGIPVAWVPLQGSARAKLWGVHCNVGTPGQAGFEQWHMQCVEMDGYDSWAAAGRHDPRAGYPLPSGGVSVPVPDTKPPRPLPTPPPQEQEEDEMPWFLSKHEPSGTWWLIRWDRERRMGATNDPHDVSGVDSAHVMHMVAGGMPNIGMPADELTAIPVW